MKFIYCFAFYLLILTSCERKAKVDYKNLKNIEFQGLRFPLPGEFVNIDLDNLIDSWVESEFPQRIINRKVEYLESLRSKEGQFQIAVDSTDINKSIIIFTGPYLKIGKWTSKQLFLTIEKKLKAEAANFGYKYSPVENSYYTLNNGNDILKVKFEYQVDSTKTYGTQYLLNSKGSSFGITISNNDDFENLIRQAVFAPR